MSLFAVRITSVKFQHELLSANFLPRLCYSIYKSSLVTTQATVDKLSENINNNKNEWKI